jgi:regulator of sirC expression with transglutaminase-like and TPR domain
VERRRGIPISLCLVYLCLAERLELPLAGVSLPSHFMLRVMDQPIPLFLDAFDKGKLLDLPMCERRLEEIIGAPTKLSPGVLAPCRLEEIVARMLRNLREIHLAEGNFVAALPVVRRLAALEPDDFRSTRDWGVVALQADHPGEAVSPLLRCAELAADEEREELARLARIARRRQAERN